MTIDTHVTIVRPGEDVTVEFWGACLESLQDHFERIGEGATGQTELKRQLISDSMVIVPERQLMDSYTDSVRSIRKMIPLLLKRNENLVKQRNILLPKLITGSILLSEEEVA